jgi:hypothetical protein
MKLATIAALASVAGLGLIGCGGADAPATAVPRLGKAQFVAKASAICARTTRDLEAAGATLSPGTSEATFVRRDVGPIFRSALRKLAALRPPGPRRGRGQRDPGRGAPRTCAPRGEPGVVEGAAR